MCGIVGIYHYREPDRPVDHALIGYMTETLAHRGPNGHGVWTAPGIGLGHRRLSIIDLSKAADQPMVDSLGRLVLTYNGEIYNFRDLRSELESAGHRFRTRSDSEVLVIGYRHWGRGLFQRLSGIFAFAIWDGEQRKLVLARDPLGVKPLFYAVDEASGTFRFGSEIKAILADPGVGREIDLVAIDAFLTFSYTPAPATGFARVRQLLPGEAMEVTAAGPRSWRFWENPYAEQPLDISFGEARDQVEACLDRVTRAQMMSDVPLGAFLSGGLDSAAVVRAMRRAGMGEVKAFCVGFDVDSFDERRLARATARKLDVELEESQVTLDAVDLLPRLSLHLEEPLADSSCLPVYLLCRGAARRFTVAMAGDGADEILAGYPTYRATNVAHLYRRLPVWLRRGLIRPLAQKLPISNRKYGLHLVATRFTYGAELGAGRDHCAWRVIMSDSLKRRLYTPAFLGEVGGEDPLAPYAAAIEAVPSTRERLAGLLNADTEFYLPNDMLVKVDRMGMAHGLEVRVPFLDVEMVRLCANLPGDYKLLNGKIQKHILRESLRGSVPREVLNAPKSGFNVPVERWMRESLGELLNDAVDTARHDLENFLDLARLREVTREHREGRAERGHVLFTVLMFALWLDNRRKRWRPAAHTDGVVPASAHAPVLPREPSSFHRKRA